MKRRGTVLIYVTIGMVAFAGFASLAIDTAHVHFAKLQLQVSADAAARAASTPVRRSRSSSNRARYSPTVLNPAST
jgi:Flp pilus assembly protein TadG